MTFKPYPIVPFTTGLERDKQPFLLENDAFPQLSNCYLYQGRIERRLGNKLLGRLVERVVVKYAGVLNKGDITYTNTLASFPISPGSVSIVITDPNPPGATLYTFVDNGSGVLFAGAGTSGTINYITGVFVINFPALPLLLGPLLDDVTATYEYYTCRPVMALPLEETVAINAEDLKAFDTRKANLFDNALGRFIDISFNMAGAAIQWNGTDSDFFWTWNYYEGVRVGGAHDKIFWATNNIALTAGLQDGIQVYNGVGWTAQNPRLNAGATRYLRGCLILVSYRNRMVALNTIESAAAFPAATRCPNRARWSQNGTPLTDGDAVYLTNFDVTAWQDDVVGKGGYIDAPTSEQIISCGFYKDTLIVFFERSTWQLFYSGNENLPFIWQRINTQFGSESTHSVVGFDKGIFAVGNVAIVTSDSVNVERIDLKIPTEVFGFHNQNDGPKRVYGIRDYFYQFVYWTFPNLAENGTYPNRVLVLNYLDGSYSFYDDSYTCFGYYQSINDLIWRNANFSWQNADPRTWTSGMSQSDFPSVVGGNQQGFVMILDQNVSNDKSLYITNITQAAFAVVTSPNHNLVKNQFVKFTGVLGMTEINNLVGKVTSYTANTFTVDIDSSAFTAYTASGFLIVLNGYDVITKKFNPFYTAGQKLRSSYGDFYVKKTTAGAVSIDFLVDDSYDNPISTLVMSTAKEYGPLTSVNKVWQRVYPDCAGQYLQMHIYLSDDQLRNPETFLEAEPSKENIVIHAINFWMAASGRLQSYDTV
jgi:hypothetical protein